LRLAGAFEELALIRDRPQISDRAH
jgi:hypothetical protein